MKANLPTIENLIPFHCPHLNTGVDISKGSTRRGKIREEDRSIIHDNRQSRIPPLTLALLFSVNR